MIINIEIPECVQTSFILRYSFGIGLEWSCIISISGHASLAPASCDQTGERVSFLIDHVLVSSRYTFHCVA